MQRQYSLTPTYGESDAIMWSKQIAQIARQTEKNLQRKFNIVVNFVWIEIETMDMSQTINHS